MSSDFLFCSLGLLKDTECLVGLDITESEVLRFEADCDWDIDVDTGEVGVVVVIGGGSGAVSDGVTEVTPVGWGEGAVIWLTECGVCGLAPSEVACFRDEGGEVLCWVDEVGVLLSLNDAIVVGFACTGVGVDKWLFVLEVFVLFDKLLLVMSLMIALISRLGRIVSKSHSKSSLSSEIDLRTIFQSK